MSEPSLPDLEARRDWLYAQLSAIGDFRRGSVTENWRRCGKPNGACAARASSQWEAICSNRLNQTGAA
jgi:hypothetical protein